jgi:hypothetical protein
MNRGGGGGKDDEDFLVSIEEGGVETNLQSLIRNYQLEVSKVQHSDQMVWNKMIEESQAKRIEWKKGRGETVYAKLIHLDELAKAIVVEHTEFNETEDEGIYKEVMVKKGNLLDYYRERRELINCITMENNQLLTYMHCFFGETPRSRLFKRLYFIITNQR